MDNVVTILCSTALASVIVKLIDVWQKRKERKDTLEDRQNKNLESQVAENTKQLSAVQTAIKLLLYDKFEFLAEKYLSKGEITLKQKKVLSEMYNAYKENLGDGWADELMEMINELPIKE